MTDAHDEKETLAVDVCISAHADRKLTALFHRTRAEYLIDHPECWICGATEKDTGEPNQLHHRHIERCFAEEDIDWLKVAEDVPEFDWKTFDAADPYSFVDNCHFNGVTLCRLHHTERDSGAHMLPYNLWIMQRYLKDGTRFSPNEVIRHDID